MPTVRDILGPHAYSLVRYGVDPDDDISAAVRKLDAAAPHLAKFIRELYPTAAGGV